MSGKPSVGGFLGPVVVFVFGAGRFFLAEFVLKAEVNSGKRWKKTLCFFFGRKTNVRPCVGVRA